MVAERPEHQLPTHVTSMIPDVVGRVVPGDQRGRTLGFPTANVLLGPDDDQVCDGVYVGAVAVRSGELRWAAVSVGTRPTYYGSQGVRLLEAFVLDYADDLYDHLLPVWLLAPIRLQVAFVDEQSLVDRLRRDVQHVRRYAARCRWTDMVGPDGRTGSRAGTTEQGGS
ncbi:riboflavin kinase [Ornithinimicrobium sufpigmenti]|uniref:riboflavin kinase n=1 Tax=Ornithinimicrobium sufpigmenti TaxID=2508882 RepID=UPI001035E86C|nr:MULTISPECIES: riboflavin kinase [unclassified Ornithinimicrobium]